MHRHKILAQVILIFSIVSFVFAAPAVRGIDEARNDVIAQVLARDAEAVAKRGNMAGKFQMPSYESEWESDSDDDEEKGYETSSDEPLDKDPSTAPATPQKLKSSKNPIMTPEKIKTVKILAGVGVLTIAVLGLVDFHVSNENSTTGN
jgi:hypothetical protein